MNRHNQSDKYTEIDKSFKANKGAMVVRIIVTQ